MSRAVRSSVPARKPVPPPIAARPRRWPSRLAAALLVLGAFAVGNVAPDLADLRPTAAPALAAPSSATTTHTPRTFPREAAALRLELDRASSPASTVELVERLGIVGDPSDFERLAALAEHPNMQVPQAAMRALARVGGDRAIDRLTVFARSNDDTAAASAIQALGLASEGEAVDVLLEVARRKSDWKQSIALQALAIRGGKRARTALHRGLKTAPVNEAYAWAQAVASLGERADRFLLMTLASGNGPRADAALNALAGLGSADSDSLLIQLASTARGQRRISALNALGSVRDPRAVDVLIDGLDGNVNVRSAALSALGMSRAPGALDGLLLAMDHVRANEAWQITGALVTRPEKQAREVLKILATEDGVLGEAALASLAQAGDPSVAALLVASFDEKGELPPESTLQFLALHGGEDGWSLLEEVLAEGSSSDQHSVVYALQSRGDEHAVTRLLDLARGEDPWLASTAMGALENLGDDAREGLRTVLMDRIDDGTGFVEAAPTLARLGGEEARDTLLGRLQDGTTQERQAALQALGQMDDEGAQAALRETMASDDPELRRQAFDAMLWSGQPLDSDTVQAALGDDDPSLRSQAVHALANLGEPEALDQLLELTGDPDPSVRTSAVSALGSVGGPDAEAGLVAALGDPDTFDTALWSLSSMGTAGAREAIRSAAADDDPLRRQTALSALSSDRSPAARSLLVDALDDDDGGVVATALSQLQMLGSSSAADAVANLLQGLDPDDDVQGLRWQAANTLQALGGSAARDHAELIQEALGYDPTDIGIVPIGHHGWDGHGPGPYLW